MRKEIFLQVHEPCHENWNKMSPVQQGRHCDSCNKNVVDFTDMSDAEIFRLMNKKDQHICGRFKESQLTRPISQPVSSARKTSWALLMSMLLAFTANFARAQTKGRIAIKHPPRFQPVNPVLKKGYDEKEFRVVLGRLSNPLRFIMVVNGKHEPLAGVTVYPEGNLKPLITDEHGHVTFDRKIQKLDLSYPGYESVSLLTSEIYNDTIQLKQKENISVRNDLKTQTISGEGIIKLGGVRSIPVRTGQNRTLVKLEAEVVASSTKPSIFVYPNPVQPGSKLTLKLDEGKYQLQLLTGAGRIVSVQSLSVENKSVAAGFKLPAAAGDGLYFLRVINLKSRQNTVTRVFISNY